MSAARVVAIGECMLELRNEGGATTLDVGGDSFNTAVYLAREGAQEIVVSYATVLGTDPYSEGIRERLLAEGLDVRLVDRVEGRHPGLYLIHLGEGGERHFLYYREASAARLLLTTAGSEDLLRATASAGWIYLTGVTLAILQERARARLLTAVHRARATGSRVAFDTNYRPSLWPDRTTARRCVEPFLHACDVALPSLDDEQALWGTSTPEKVIERLAGAGVHEIVVKLGDKGVVLSDGHTTSAVDALRVDRPADTTAAGDAFNGAYLAARIRGERPVAAARRGVRLAARVVCHRGAIMPAAAPSSGRGWADVSSAR